jgi:hypothetical protein
MIRIGKNPHMRTPCAPSRIWELIRRALTQPLCDPYRPEQHYMRGPGPKYRAQRIERNAKTPAAAVTSGVNDKPKSD